MSADALLLGVPSVFKAAGALQQGADQSAAFRIRAQSARDKARVDEAAQRRQGRQVIGKQAAAMSESGAGIDEGVLQQSTVAAELDALNIRYGGLLESFGLERAARSTARQSKFLAGGELLAGASRGLLFDRLNRA